MIMNKYINKIIDILYRDSDAFSLNLKMRKEYKRTEQYDFGVQKLHLIPYLGKKGTKQDIEECERIIKKVNSVIWQYKLDMWDQHIKDGITFDDMTGAMLPSKEELAEQGNLNFIDPKGNA